MPKSKTDSKKALDIYFTPPKDPDIRGRKLSYWLKLKEEGKLVCFWVRMPVTVRAELKAKAARMGITMNRLFIEGAIAYPPELNDFRNVEYYIGVVETHMKAVVEAVRDRTENIQYCKIHMIPRDLVTKRCPLCVTMSRDVEAREAKDDSNDHAKSV